MPKTVVGLYETQAAAETAVNALVAAGFSNDQIGVSLRGETRAASASSNDPLLAQTDGPAASDKAAVIGYGTGAVAGGALGAVLATVGTLVAPGVGTVIGGAVGTILGGGLAGAGLGAGAAALSGGMAAQATSDDRVDIFADVLQYGGVVLTVETGDERAALAEQVFRSTGAVDLASREPGKARNANEAAVQEADATDRAAVADVAQALKSPGDTTLHTPSAATPLASDTAVAATEPSGLASLRPGTSNEPQSSTAPTTAVGVPDSDVLVQQQDSVGARAALYRDDTPSSKGEPYLTLDPNDAQGSGAGH